MVHFLQFIKSLNLLPIQEQDQLIKTFEYEEVKKGTLILTPGKRAQYLYFIESGLVRTYFISDKGMDMTTSFFKEHEVVTSADSFFNQSISKIGIEALEDVELMRISFKSLEQLSIEFPELDKVKFDFLLFFFNKNNERLMSTISLPAIERYKILLEEVPEILNRAPLGHIATFLGISRETLSRIRGKF